MQAFKKCLHKSKALELICFHPRTALKSNFSNQYMYSFVILCTFDIHTMLMSVSFGPNEIVVYIHCSLGYLLVIKGN